MPARRIGARAELNGRSGFTRSNRDLVVALLLNSTLDCVGHDERLGQGPVAFDGDDSAGRGDLISAATKI